MKQLDEYRLKDKSGASSRSKSARELPNYDAGRWQLQVYKLAMQVVHVFLFQLERVNFRWPFSLVPSG